MTAVVEAENAGIPNVSLVNEIVPKDLEVQCLLKEMSTKNEISFNPGHLEAVRGERLLLTASTKVVEGEGANNTLRRKISFVKKRGSGHRQEELDRRQPGITTKRSTASTVVLAEGRWYLLRAAGRASILKRITHHHLVEPHRGPQLLDVSPVWTLSTGNRYLDMGSR